jgi:hypothetical protein
LKQNLTKGVHTFRVKDNAGCMVNFTDTIKEPGTLNVSATITPISCFGHSDGTIVISANGGTPPYQYKTATTVYQSNSVFTGLSPQPYAITTKDSKGCEKRLDTTLSSPAPVIAGAISGDSSVLKNTVHTYATVTQSGLSYLWFADKGTVVNGQNTPVAQINWDDIGSGNVYVAVYSSATCGDTSSFAVTIGATGMAELGRQMGIEVYPNPTKNSVNIDIKVLPENAVIELYDVLGKMVLTQELKTKQQLDLGALPHGAYMLKIGDWRGSVIKE